MNNDFDVVQTKAAGKKMESGAYLTLSEVSSLLDLSVSTIHRLPLPSIRLGRSLRYDPKDINRLLDSCREPIAA